MKHYPPPYARIWGKPGKGKYHKRAHNRAARRAAKGTGKPNAAAGWATEIGYGKHYAATGKPA